MQSLDILKTKMKAFVRVMDDMHGETTHPKTDVAIDLACDMVFYVVKAVKEIWQS